ncbi:hypothetical protein QQF64_002775 [Cirrhinus molitorella]|uniref:Uncharacterized protein n=1 Tax=Cirrhinus molitorella TaxID=172907 RepID=A0ABR3MRA5_9TELE
MSETRRATGLGFAGLHLSDGSIHLAPVPPTRLFGRIQHFHFLCCQCAAAPVPSRCRYLLPLSAPHRSLVLS